MEKRLIDYIIQLKSQCRFEERIGGECALTSREVSCLGALPRGQAVSAGELAERMELSASRASRVINGLREKGCLTEDYDRDDRRAVSITLTKKGERLLDAIERKKDECEQRLLRRIDRRRVQSIRDSLGVLATAMQGAADED
jgi:DNA-binding MarR family transcriptional regulator